MEKNIGLPGEEEVEEEEVEEEFEIKGIGKETGAILKNLVEHSKISEEQLKQQKSEWINGLEEWENTELRHCQLIRLAEAVIDKYAHLNKDISDEKEYLIKIAKEKEARELRGKEKIKELEEGSKKKDKKIAELDNIDKVKVDEENKKLRLKIKELNAEVKNLQVVKKKLDLEKKDIKVSTKMVEAYKRYHGGESQKSIAKDMGKNDHTISAWIRKVGIKEGEEGRN